MTSNAPAAPAEPAEDGTCAVVPVAVHTAEIPCGENGALDRADGERGLSGAHGKLGIVVALILSAGAVGLLTGCSSGARQTLLAFFFDLPGAEQRPPTTRVRRDLLREIDGLKRDLERAKAEAKARAAPAKQAELSAERAKTWDEAAVTLPLDGAGGADWVQALKAGAIAPRPGADPKAPAQAVLDLDVEFANSGRLFRAGFSHSAHTAWLACGNCHPSLFPLKRTTPTVVTMAAMRRGAYCGACHGTVAFGVDGRCARCHAAIPAKAEWRPAEPRAAVERATGWTEAARLLPQTEGTPDWTKALAQGVIAPRAGIDPNAKEEEGLDLDVVRSEKEPAKVVFPHAAHTAWLVCDSCHPEPFKQEAGATAMSMDRINDGLFCGLCHGKVAFPLDACPRCHPAIGG